MYHLFDPATGTRGLNVAYGCIVLEVLLRKIRYDVFFRQFVEVLFACIILFVVLLNCDPILFGHSFVGIRLFSSLMDRTGFSLLGTTFIRSCG
jgi:hypothetical protein